MLTLILIALFGIALASASYIAGHSDAASEVAAARVEGRWAGFRSANDLDVAAVSYAKNSARAAGRIEGRQAAIADLKRGELTATWDCAMCGAWAESIALPEGWVWTGADAYTCGEKCAQRFEKARRRIDDDRRVRAFDELAGMTAEDAWKGDDNGCDKPSCGMCHPD